jgi:hypothetical protein
MLSFAVKGFLMIRRRATLLLVLALGFSPLLRASNGKFHFGKVTFEPADVFAYQTDDAKPVTIVVMTSFKRVLGRLQPAG